MQRQTGNIISLANWKRCVFKNLKIARIFRFARIFIYDKAIKNK